MGEHKIQILNADQKIQKILIAREIKHQQYLPKFNYDIKKAFSEFLCDLNKVMFFKLSRNYQDFDFSNRVFDPKNIHYLMHHCRFFMGEKIYQFRKNLPRHKIKYFRDLTKKIQDDDFDKYITEMENFCQNAMSPDVLECNYRPIEYEERIRDDNESDNESDSDIDEELIF